MEIKYIQTLLLAGVFGLQYLFEHLFPQEKKINDWKNERFNLGIGTLNFLLSLIPAPFFVQWLVMIQSRGYGLLHQVTLPAWLQITVTILILDFWMYFWHRMNHRLPWLWRFHSFHHKDEKMNSTTAIRFHILELYLSYPGKGLVCFLFGIDYIPLLVYEILFFASIVVHHSNIRITERFDQRYRLLFASPMMHRIHHSNKQKETDSNYGALFSFWDRMFRSWRGRPQQPIQFGIPQD